jgi:hypothetical protein
VVVVAGVKTSGTSSRRMRSRGGKWGVLWSGLDENQLTDQFDVCFALLYKFDSGDGSIVYDRYVDEF